MSIGEYIAEMGAGEVENTGADSVLDGEVGVEIVSCSIVFFFFQAEDGIRDLTVTGVQTCALPIFSNLARRREMESFSFLEILLKVPSVLILSIEAILRMLLRIVAKLVSIPPGDRKSVV